MSSNIQLPKRKLGKTNIEVTHIGLGMMEFAGGGGLMGFMFPLIAQEEKTILRGLGETRIPMFANLAGHWLVGLPLGYAACFWWGWGVQGLWLGLAAGLTAVGSALLATWVRRARKALPEVPHSAPAG